MAPEAGSACRLGGGGESGIIRRVFGYKTIAVVGCSPKPERPSHYVAAYLKQQGYRIVPVNPGHAEILGETCFESLLEIPFKIDVVDVFRRPEDVPPVVDDAIMIKAEAVWLQSGITEPESEEKARRAGLLVVSDRCMLVEHRALR